MTLPYLLIFISLRWFHNKYVLLGHITANKHMFTSPRCTQAKLGILDECCNRGIQASRLSNAFSFLPSECKQVGSDLSIDLTRTKYIPHLLKEAIAQIGVSQFRRSFANLLSFLVL